MSRKQRKLCQQFFHDLESKGKKCPKFNQSLGILKSYVAANGLEDKDFDQLANIIMTIDIGATCLVPLITCLIPKYKVPKDTVKSIITWCLAHVYKLPITVSTVLIQWIIGILDHQLIDKKVVNIYYHVFFHVMLKKAKLGKHIAHLIYILGKPEDVTRRDVCRLLNVQKQSSRPVNHIAALLSLFKSYKPELVPERVPSVSMRSASKGIPEVLRSMLENARTRLKDPGIVEEESFNWNTLKTTKTKKNVLPLVPSVGYFRIGSNIFKEHKESIFDITSFEQLGKLHFNVELPSNAVSLLSNTAGYHLLTCADVQYQSRFAYNLYNALLIGLTLEPDRVHPEDMNKLLDMTIEFSRYIQQSIPTVNHFMHEYFYFNMEEYRSKFLALLEWMTSVSSTDLQDIILVYVRNTFYQSSVAGKCELIGTLRALLLNLFVSEAFEERCEKLSFLGQAPAVNLAEVVPILMKASENLIVSGLNIHSYDILLLSEALSFYEQVCVLEARSMFPFFTQPPAAVIYGCFVTNNCGILSRLCKLLSRYRQRIYNLTENELPLFKTTVITVASYTQDIVGALCHNEVFKTRGNTYFLNKISKRVMNDLRSYQINCLLNVSNHSAILPCKSMLAMSGIEVSTNEDAMRYVSDYYPDIHQFISTFEN